MATVAEKVAAASVRHWSTTVTVGDVLKTWHDDGRGGSVYFWRVLKVCPRTIKARGERGEVIYKPVSWFNGKLSALSVYELHEQGINI